MANAVEFVFGPMLYATFFAMAVVLGIAIITLVVEMKRARELSAATIEQVSTEPVFDPGDYLAAVDNLRARSISSKTRRAGEAGEHIKRVAEAQSFRHVTIMAQGYGVPGVRPKFIERSLVNLLVEPGARGVLFDNTASLEKSMQSPMLAHSS